MEDFKPLRDQDPSNIGSYAVIRRLGSGGQGTVYLVRTSNGALVALKLLHAHFAGDETAQSRFLREVDAARRVSAYTARVLDLGTHRGVPYVVSEYIPGESLASYISREGPLQSDPLHRLASGTLIALAAIHAGGIVHCDFKPENILLDSDGPRVIDFGIARALDTITSNVSRRIGTPAYMAPEQVDGGKLSPYTDMFAWAATMIFAATGKHAFDGSSLAAIMSQIIAVDPDVSGIPMPLKKVVSASFSKPPKQRPSATEALLWLLEGKSPNRIFRGNIDASRTVIDSTIPAHIFGLQVGVPLRGQARELVTIAYSWRDGRPILIANGAGSASQMWDLATGQQIGEPLAGHTEPVWAVACTVLGDRAVCVTGSADRTARVWDLTTGQQIGEPLAGHTEPVRAVACTALGDRAVCVTGSADRTARVWDLTTGQQIGEPLAGHTLPVYAVACTALGDRAVCVTGSADRTARVWDLTIGQQIGEPLAGHTLPVYAVACTALGGLNVAITGGFDGTVRTWSLG
ncbi:protein kinase [Actinomadura latina]|uniref:Protein kinase n=1 Tax=Actinomadura latina TaxID=163603 RepID=A0A846Z0K3_9ACTN|nr:protein kinase [Actinomadura latina]